MKRRWNLTLEDSTSHKTPSKQRELCAIRVWLSLHFSKALEETVSIVAPEEAFNPVIDWDHMKMDRIARRMT
jgi:hypothetical protein